LISKGSGAVADIITFAYEEMNAYRNSDFEDALKPEITRLLLEEFNEELSKNDILRNIYRDKILSIVSKSIKGTQKFISIINMSGWSTLGETEGVAFNFNYLDKYIIQSLMNSQRQYVGRQQRLNWRLIYV
jgi:hypothetical protein